MIELNLGDLGRNNLNEDLKGEEALADLAT